jgi:hypothetical protein
MVIITSCEGLFWLPALGLYNDEFLMWLNLNEPSAWPTLSGVNYMPICKSWRRCLWALVPAGLGFLGGFGVHGAEGAAAVPTAARQLPARADIRFYGTSTLHDFAGVAPAQPFVLVEASNTWSARGAVVIGGMNTGHDGRDKAMMRMFGTNDFPQLHGEVKSAPLPPAGTNFTLAFCVRDQTNNLTARISNWTEDAGVIRFHAEWEVSLKQYGLKPPSVLGLVRVGDCVRVEADVTASTAPPPTNTATKPLSPAFTP